jgi:hypothetical protein
VAGVIRGGADDLDGETKPVSEIEQKARNRFGMVLLLLLVTFVFLSLGATGPWARPVSVALLGATLLATLTAAQVMPRWRRMAAVVVLVAFTASVAAVAIDGAHADGATALLNACFVAVAPIAIARSVWRRGVIDVQTLLASLCIYVLLGMFWAFMYTGIGYIANDPFFAQSDDATSAEYLYFSFITLTTAGYGDLTAAGSLGRSLAALEALFGQIYLVTIVATLVSRFRPAADRAAVEEERGVERP